ncbi:MAG: ABC transporter ATP-binding protein [Paracoccaceae bacterium]
MITVSSLQRSGLGRVDFTVDDGECLAITGPSGAGKSLLMRAIVDLDPNTGEVATAQLTRSETPAPEWRKHVALLPSETGWWLDNVSEHFSEPTETAKLMPIVGLSPDALNWEVARLSSGERHRLGLLRCLEGMPKVLLLDEPTAALDPETTLKVEAMLQVLLSKGITIILVTHDPAQPARLGCKTMLIENGQVVA